MTDDTKRTGWPADPPPTREELEQPHDATLRLQELQRDTRVTQAVREQQVRCSEAARAAQTRYAEADLAAFKAGDDWRAAKKALTEAQYAREVALEDFKRLQEREFLWIRIPNVLEAGRPEQGK